MPRRWSAQPPGYYSLGGAAGAQTPCPPSAATALEHAWRAYRSDSLPAAVAQFQMAHRLCPDNLDADIGLGFAMLRSEQAFRADSIFRRALGRTHRNSDAWEGRARAACGSGTRQHHSMPVERR